MNRSETKPYVYIRINSIISAHTDLSLRSLPEYALYPWPYIKCSMAYIKPLGIKMNYMERNLFVFHYM